MKVIFSGTLAAFVLGAAIASSQTPYGEGQSQGKQPSTAQPSGDQKGGQQQSGTQRRTTGARNQTNRNQTVTYRGFLRGSAAEGWTILPIANRATGRTPRSAGASEGAVGTSGEMQTFSVMTSEGSKVDLASLADQCVEIVGSLSPDMGMSSGGVENPGGQTPDAAGGQAPENPEQLRTMPGAKTPTATSGHTMHRTLTVSRIRAVQGGCTQ